MQELTLHYGLSKRQRITNVVIFSYFAGFGLFFCVKEGLAGQYGVMFICSMACFLLAAILILKNTLWLPAPILEISGEKILSNQPNHKSMVIEWVSISRVNIGPGYLVFMVDGGQKQRKLELLSLKYEDILAVKSKVIELCEYKNIPYHND